MSVEQETERRASLTNSQARALQKYMASVGTLLQIRRVLIDFEVAQNDTIGTMRVRVNNGIIEIGAKDGVMTDETRNEITILPSSNTVDAQHFLRMVGYNGNDINPNNVIAATKSVSAALLLVSLLGYTKAHVGIRDVYEVVDGPLVLSLRWVIRLSTGQIEDQFFEAELATDAHSTVSNGSTNNSADAYQPDTKPLNEFFARQQLRAFQKDEFVAWSHHTKDMIDIAFNYSTQAAAELELMLADAGMLK